MVCHVAVVPKTVVYLVQVMYLESSPRKPCALVIPVGSWGPISWGPSETLCPVCLRLVPWSGEEGRKFSLSVVSVSGLLTP